MPQLDEQKCYLFSPEEKVLIGKKIEEDARASAMEWDHDAEKMVFSEWKFKNSLPTPAELELFIYFCQQRRLNVLTGDVYFQKRGGKATYMTSIGKLQAIAEETGTYAPGPAPKYYNQGGGEM